MAASSPTEASLKYSGLTLQVSQTNYCYDTKNILIAIFFGGVVKLMLKNAKLVSCGTPISSWCVLILHMCLKRLCFRCNVT